MKPPPPGWPRISSALFYNDAAAAIDWLCNAFGFECRFKAEGENGRIEHSQLVYGDGLIMVSEAEGRGFTLSPAETGRNTQCLALYIDDVDAHCERARAAGARIIDEPSDTDYGPGYWADRGYQAADLEGHHWWFMQRLRTD